MILKAVYVDGANRWDIYAITSSKEEKLYEYTIDQVPTEFIVAQAVLHRVVDESVFDNFKASGVVPENVMSDIAYWFSESFFRSKKFGRILIREFRELVEQIESKL